MNKVKYLVSYVLNSANLFQNISLLHISAITILAVFIMGTSTCDTGLDGIGPGFTQNVPDSVETIKDCGPNKKQCFGWTSDCVPLDTVCCSLTANFDSHAQICGNRCIVKEAICCEENTKSLSCTQDKPICCSTEDFPFPGPSCAESLELCNCVLPMFADSYPDISVCDDNGIPILNSTNCFSYEDIIESECPAELVLTTCEPYECIECTGLHCYETNTFFPYSYSGCGIIDCNTIVCDKTGEIHIDEELSWIEYKIGEEIETRCYQ